MATDIIEGLPNTSLTEGIRKAIQHTLARTSDGRVSSILNKVFRLLDMNAVEALQCELDGLSDASKLKREMNLAAVPQRLAAAASQAAALDLDKQAPSRVLGVGRIHGHLLFCAQSLGHHVEAACPSLESYDRLMTLYSIPSVLRQNANEFPAGQFQLITAGNLIYSSSEAWSGFFRSLIPAPADDGRIFCSLSKQPVAARDFVPDDVLAMFERQGVKVLHQMASVILTKEQITRFYLPPKAAQVLAAKSSDEQLHQESAPQSAHISHRAEGIIAGIVIFIAAAIIYWAAL